MTTSVSSYRSGSPRFGTRDSKSVHGEVVSYTMSPEELETYKNEHPSKKLKKPPARPFENIHTYGERKVKQAEEKRKEENGPMYLTKENYLKFKSEGKTDNEINELYKMSHNLMAKLKKEWNLIGQFGPAAKAIKKTNEGPNIMYEKQSQEQITDQKDTINPDHYKVGGIETYDFIQAKLIQEGLKGYLSGNIIKYVSRFDHKNGVEDLKKAQWYLEKLVGLGE